MSSAQPFDKQSVQNMVGSARENARQQKGLQRARRTNLHGFITGVSSAVAK